MKLRTHTAVAGVILLASVGSLFSQDCLDPVTNWRYGVSNGVAAEGDVALLANGAVLQVVDLTDPSTPAVLGELDLLQQIEAVALSGSRGYAATDSLHVIDLTTPAAPSQIGVLGGFSSVYGIAVVGDLVHVLGYRKLYVVDAGTPSAPVVAGEFEWSDVVVRDVAAVSDYVFLSAGDDGLRVVDVSDPTTPNEIATVDFGTDTSALALDVVNGLAYVTGTGPSNESRLFVVDVTDPAHPVLDADVVVANRGDIVIRDGLAHIEGYSELHIYDVSVAQTPEWLGSAAMPYDWGGTRLAGVDNRILWASSFRGLTVVDTTDPTAPAPAGVVDAPGRNADAVYSDGILYIAAEERGLRVVDVSDPSLPVELGFIQVVPSAFGVAVRGDIAYVLSFSYLGLVAVDVSDPAAPVILGNAPDARGDWVTIAGNYAYAIVGWSGLLSVVDLSTPALPVLVGSLDLPPGTGHKWEWPVVSGDHLFVRNNHNDPTIAIVDVGDPTAPVQVGSIDVNANVAGLAVTGAWLLVPDFDAEPVVRVFDVGNPAAPVEQDPYVPVSGYTEAVAVSGSVAYLSMWIGAHPDYEFAVEAVDFANPLAPEFLGLSHETGRVRRLPIGPEEVFAVTHETGFDVFEIHDVPLFADGFESGDTSVWTAVVPSDRRIEIRSVPSGDPGKPGTRPWWYTQLRKAPKGGYA